MRIAASLLLGFIGCATDVMDGADGVDGARAQDGSTQNVTAPNAGGVYVMTNELYGNQVASYARNFDGTLEFLGSVFTGGIGSDAFDGPEGLDPLISAYAIEKTEDNRFVLAVNAGSKTVSSFRVEPDRTLSLVDIGFTRGVGPNSIAISGSLVYVSNIAQLGGSFAGEPDQEGSIVGFTLDADGMLQSIPGSLTNLDNRPSAVRFSPDGSKLLVTSINSGSSALASGSEDELVVFDIDAAGLPTRVAQAGPVTSTLRGNGVRNLPSAIGFEVVEDATGRDIVVVTEAREFQPDGSPPAFPALQTGSVSTWELAPTGELFPLQLDVLADESGSLDGSRTACWLAFSADQGTFWVSNAIEASLSAYSFGADGSIQLENGVAAQGNPAVDPDPAIAFGETDGWIDLDVSDDGQFLYQLYGLAGTVGVFRIEADGLVLVEEVVGDIPLQDTQGIIAF